MLKKLFGFGKPPTEKPDNHAMQLGVDLGMNYCPKCGDEYRAGIEQCVSCNVALISGEEKFGEIRRQVQEKNDRARDISPDDTLVAIRTGKLKDLKAVQYMLQKEHIPSLLTGEAAAAGKG